MESKDVRPLLAASAAKSCNKICFQGCDQPRCWCSHHGPDSPTNLKFTYSRGCASSRLISKFSDSDGSAWAFKVMIHAQIFELDALSLISCTMLRPLGMSAAVSPHII